MNPAAPGPLSSLSVVTNANRLRRFTAPPLPASGVPARVEPIVGAGDDEAAGLVTSTVIPALELRATGEDGRATWPDSQQCLQPHRQAP